MAFTKVLNNISNITYFDIKEDEIWSLCLRSFNVEYGGRDFHTYSYHNDSIASEPSRIHHRDG
jgi:hypothetical protein